MWRCLTALFLLMAPLGAQDSAPAAPPKPAAVLGEVTRIDTEAGRLDVKTDAGATSTVAFDTKTTWLKAQPGAKDLTGAAPAVVTDLSVGDRILARGFPSGEPPVLGARQIVVMVRGDITQKQDRERDDWRRRGVAGVVQAVDPVTKRVTLRMASFGPGEPVVVSTSERPAALLRYAPDSARFADARPGTFEQIQVGDQLRALGDRVEGVVLAEKVVSGAFRTVLGVVGETGSSRFTLKPEDGGEPVAVTVSDDTVLRRVPPEMAARFAERGGGRPGAGAPPASPGGEGAAPEGPGGGRRGRPGGDLIDRLPTIAPTELKAGDRVLVSCPQGREAREVNAIAVVAGLEAFAPRERAGGRGGADTNLGLPPGILDMAAGLQ